MSNEDTQETLKKLNIHSEKVSSDFNMLEGYIKHISFVKSQIEIHGLQSNDLEEILALNDNIKSIYYKCKETIDIMGDEIKSLPIDIIHSDRTIIIHSPKYILKLLEKCHKDKFYIMVTKIDRLKDSKYRKPLNRKFLAGVSKMLSILFDNSTRDEFHLYFENSHKLITILEAKEETKADDVKLLKQYRHVFSPKISKKYFYDKYIDDSYIDTTTNIFLIDTKEHLIDILKKEIDTVSKLA